MSERKRPGLELTSICGTWMSMSEWKRPGLELISICGTWMSMSEQNSLDSSSLQYVVPRWACLSRRAWTRAHCGIKYLDEHVWAEEPGLELTAIFEGEWVNREVPVADDPKHFQVLVDGGAAFALQNSSTWVYFRQIRNVKNRTQQIGKRRCRPYDTCG